MIRLALALSALLVLGACQSSEERAEEHYQSALALLEEGDIERASVEFRNVFQLDGFHVEARRAFAEALRSSGDVQQAYGQFLLLSEQQPDDVGTRVALAEMALDDQNIEQLRIHGARAIELTPEDERDTLLFRAVQVVLDYSEALENDNTAALDEAAAAAAEVLAETPESLPIRRVVIDYAMRNDDMTAALASVDEALAIYPDNRELHGTKLALLARLEDAEGLVVQLRDMIARFPDNDDLVAMLLRFYVARDNAAAAEDFLRERIAAESDPERSVTLRRTLVQFLVQVSGPQAALAEADVLVESFPDDVSYRILRASLRFSSGARDEAIAELEAVVEGATASEVVNEARITLARMYVETGNPVGARRLVGEVLESDPGQTAALRLEAAWLIEGDRADDAIALLRRALDETPEDADAMTLMASAHQRNGNHGLARDFLSLAYETSNAAPAETLRYADNLIADGLNLVAEEALINALRVQPGNLAILERLGRIYISMEDWPRAEQVEQTARRIGSTGAVRFADSLRASRLAAQGLMSDAIDFLQDLADRDGMEGDLAVQIAVVRAMLSDGRTDEALDYLNTALEANPDSLGLLMARATALGALERRPEAIADYRRVIEAEPRFERAWVELIRLEFREGDADEAVALLEEALEIMPDGSDLQWAQASFLEQSGDIDGAISIYEQLYDRLPNSLIVANNLASLITTYRTDEESLERAYSIARRLRGTELPALMDTYGWIAFRRGDIEEARPYLETAAEQLPNNALVQYHYGMLLSAAGEADAAVTQLTRSLELAGSDDPRPQFVDAREELQRLQDGGEIAQESQ